MRKVKMCVMALLVALSGCNKSEETGMVPSGPDIETALPLFQITTTVRLKMNQKYRLRWKYSKTES